ncbi:MAG: cyclic di-GMP phosphodiesterase [Actinomycetota bacterium]|nr:cyclic di-GMP phosphodiesterase [Actinomycetota bacterium]
MTTATSSPSAGKPATAQEMSRTMDESTRLGTVLVVDDEAMVRRNLTRLLTGQGYSCTTASSADEARAALANEEFDLILSDVNMPGGSGLELLEDVARNHPDTATVMVTGVDDRALAERAMDMGAYGYVIKPFEANEILIDISNALRRRMLEIENRRHREKLELMVHERTADLWSAVRNLEAAQRDLTESREDTIQRLAIAAEFRDVETARHVDRMSRYCELIARKLGEDYDRCELIRTASAMHDVGTIGIPDKILLKPGRLDSEELDVMRTHAALGNRILEGSRSELLQTAATIALSHHEWWDGSGYPYGLSGEEIPLEGRIAAIGDVFDALTSNRVYRKGYPLGEAVELMASAHGTHFDPRLLDLFLGSLADVVAVGEGATVR